MSHPHWAMGPYGKNEGIWLDSYCEIYVKQGTSSKSNNVFWICVEEPQRTPAALQLKHFRHLLISLSISLTLSLFFLFYFFKSCPNNFSFPMRKYIYDTPPMLQTQTHLHLPAALHLLFSTFTRKLPNSEICLCDHFSPVQHQHNFDEAYHDNDASQKETTSIQAEKHQINP